MCRRDGAGDCRCLHSTWFPRLGMDSESPHAQGGEVRAIITKFLKAPRNYVLIMFVSGFNHHPFTSLLLPHWTDPFCRQWC